MNIDGYVHARVITPHLNTCDSNWKFDAAWGRDVDVATDSIAMVLCDARGRRGNGGRVFYVLCCTAHYRCPAEAIVSKSYLHEQAINLLEGVNA